MAMTVSPRQFSMNPRLSWIDLNPGKILQYSSKREQAHRSNEQGFIASGKIDFKGPIPENARLSGVPHS